MYCCAAGGVYPPPSPSPLFLAPCVSRSLTPGSRVSPFAARGCAQWAELTLLLVSQRLASALQPPQSPLMGDGSSGGEVVAGSGGNEAAEARESCRGMAARLSELDPMHGRFYDFVERGGSVLGGLERRSAAEET